MQDVAVNAIHVATFCWTISRIWAPRLAWRPNKIDAGAGAIAAFSWFIMLAIATADREWQAIAEEPLAALVGFVLLGSVYVGLVYLSIRIRTTVYSWRVS